MLYMGGEEGGGGEWGDVLQDKGSKHEEDVGRDSTCACGPELVLEDLIEGPQQRVLVAAVSPPFEGSLQLLRYHFCRPVWRDLGQVGELQRPEVSYLQFRGG